VKKFNNNEIIKTYGVGIRTPHSPSLFIDWWFLSCEATTKLLICPLTFQQHYTIAHRHLETFRLNKPQVVTPIFLWFYVNLK
jgi:hypothetical protein